MPDGLEAPEPSRRRRFWRREPRLRHAGAPHAPPAAEGAHAPLRVMSWNIHAGICPAGRYDLNRVIALARRHAPDILALQEVEGRGRAAEAPFRQLCEALGGHSVEAPTLGTAGPDGAYGHMLISRWPITDAAVHDISCPGREPRAAIAATVQAPGGPLRVIAAHFGLRGGERRFQATKLAALAKATDLPVLAMGDFNEWSWRGAVDGALLSVMPGRTRQRTFPVARPLFSLDRIYARPRGLLRRSWTDAAAREASDHLPVLAEIVLPPPAA
ncbi:endonuclease/exonuclease/phosphatase family protein [Roseomonas elaeocarpi]|uniref:Endonuclease/exonuclease/phosphatase family protein n=1 Tax=Roseomonas elaeocarpi TaxID=907779 RepID=A0ABV6JWC0_9PROT